MGTKISANIQSTDQSLKKTSKSITDLNPFASNESILDFTDSLFALSTNVINKVDKITKTELTNSVSPLSTAIPVETNDTSVVTIDGLTATINLNALDATQDKFTDVTIHFAASLGQNVQSAYDGKMYVIPTVGTKPDATDGVRYLLTPTTIAYTDGTPSMGLMFLFETNALAAQGAFADFTDDELKIVLPPITYGGINYRQEIITVKFTYTA